MDIVIGFIVSSPEYLAWGWNIETLVNITINALTVNATIGVSKQAKQVWRERSVIGLSGPTFSYLLFYCLAFMVYGIEKGALNMVIASLIAFAYIPIVLGIWRFGTQREKTSTILWSYVFSTLPFIMMQGTTQSKEKFLGLLLVGMLSLLVVAFEKFRRTPGIGNVNPAFSWAFLAAGLFWIPYSLMLGAIGLVLFNAGMAMIMGATLVIYYSRKKKMVRV